MFNLHPNARTAIFIDGANNFRASRAANISIDWRKLLTEVQDNSIFVRAFYYTAMLDNNPAEYNGLVKLVDWLNYNGYHVVTKRAKTITSDSGKSFIKGNMDIELAIDMLQMAPHYDTAILFSGDGDFCRLLDAVQRQGKRVLVVSTQNYTADELRRQCDEYFELNELPELMLPKRELAVENAE